MKLIKIKIYQNITIDLYIYLYHSFLNMWLPASHLSGLLLPAGDLVIPAPVTGDGDGAGPLGSIWDHFIHFNSIVGPFEIISDSFLDHLE